MKNPKLINIIAELIAFYSIATIIFGSILVLIRILLGVSKRILSLVTQPPANYDSLFVYSMFLVIGVLCFVFLCFSIMRQND